MKKFVFGVLLGLSTLANADSIMKFPSGSVQIICGDYSLNTNVLDIQQDLIRAGLPPLPTLRVNGNEARSFYVTDNGNSYVSIADGMSYPLEKTGRQVHEFKIYFDRYADIVKAKHEREENPGMGWLGK